MRSRRLNAQMAAACALIAFVACLAPASLAQTVAPESEPEQAPQTEKDARETTGSQGSLSEKLDASRGVITPPQNVDPRIQVPAPDPNPGTTKVIPPPGSPGGDQSLVPK